MNKSDLITSMATASSFSKKDSETSLNAIMASVQDLLKKGKKITLVGFGTFEVRARAARKGRNPQTKQEIDIPATKVPVFRAGKNLKEKVNTVKK